jgi:hypothetical protein
MAMANEPYSEVANAHDVPPRSRQRDPSWIAAQISRRQIELGYHAYA